MAGMPIGLSLPAWRVGLVYLLMAMATPGFAQVVPTVPVGQVVDATFFDRYWQEHRLADLRKHRASVLFFATVECPMVARNLPKIDALAEAMSTRDVTVMVVHVGAGDRFVDAAGQTTLLAPQARFAWDRTQRIAKACGVQRTNTAVILDAEGRMRYRGRVDGAGYAGQGMAVPGEDLGRALEQVMAGSEPPEVETAVAGCLLTPPAEPHTDSAPTYFDHIMPLMDRACFPCHQDHDSTGVRLVLPADLDKHAAMVGEVVDNGRMPPWFAAQGDVPFVNQRLLTEADRAAVRGWLRAGRPRGVDQYTLRHPTHRAWQTGPVDRVLEVREPVEIPATGRISYEYRVLGEPFPTDTWIEALEVRSQTPRAWRHANVALVAGDAYEPARWVANATPHEPGWHSRPGTALRIPAGHRLALQACYEPMGVAGQDRLTVGLRFPRGEVRREVQVATFGNSALAVPPGVAAHRVEAKWTANVAGEGCGVFVHMHGRGRDCHVKLLEKGVARSLLLVPTYSFAKQSA